MAQSRDLVKVQVESKLRPLTPVLSKWTKLVLEYTKSMEDACWWYNERASVSIFVGAAWQCGNWLALEEYSTLKRARIPAEGISPDSDRRGKCDLYLSKNRGSDYAVEAKHAWQPIGRTGRDPIVHRAMEAAWKDAGRLLSGEAAVRVALTFVVPHIAISHIERLREGSVNARVRELVVDWLERTDIIDSSDASAYCFPWDCTNFHAKPRGGKGGGRIFPGVLAILRTRQRGGRGAVVL